MHAAHSKHGHNTVRLLLSVGIDPNAITRGNLNALMLAARNGSPLTVTYLLDAGAQIHSADEFGARPIHYAAAFNPDPWVVDALLQGGASVDALSSLRQTPLDYAIRFNRSAPVVERLIEAGADARLHKPASPAFGRAYVGIMSWATYAGNEGAFALLLNRLPAEANRQWVLDDALQSLMHNERHIRHWNEVVPQLFTASHDLSLDEAFNPSAPPRRPVAIVLRILACLLHEGANPDMQTYGRSSLHEAAMWMNPEVVEALLVAGATVDLRDDVGRTPLMDAASFSSSVESVQILISAGARLDIRDGHGQTPLLCSTSNAKPDILRILIDLGADARVRDGVGKTALMTAAASGLSSQVIDLLIENGAPVDETDEFGRTALMHAALPRFKLPGTYGRAIDRLVTHGADMNARDGNGMTPLMHAVKRARFTEAAKALIDIEALLDRQDEDGMTALMHAAKTSRKPEVVMVLIDAGANARLRSLERLKAVDYWATNRHLADADEVWRLNDVSFD